MSPLHLSDLDPQRAADELTRSVYARAQRDARHLGALQALKKIYERLGKNEELVGVLRKLVPLQEGAAGTVLAQSKLHKHARACVAWATLGKGKPEDVAVSLRELRAALDGVEPGEASGREPDLTTVAGLTLVAAGARLALAEGRTVDAIEVATLASLDDRSIRATVNAGKLEPVAGGGRPMRFAPDVARQYLYARGVPGFAAAPPRSGSL